MPRYLVTTQYEPSQWALRNGVLDIDTNTTELRGAFFFAVRSAAVNLEVDGERREKKLTGRYAREDSNPPLPLQSTKRGSIGVIVP